MKILLLVVARAGDLDVFGRHLLPEGIAVVKLLGPPTISGGNPRSIDRMMAASSRRFPFGGIIFGVVHRPRDQWMVSMVERCSIYCIDDDEYRRHGAAESRRHTRDD